MGGYFMSKITKCSVIIYDDFNNILIAERGKGKKDSPKKWGIFGRNMRGKESEEDCISKVVDKTLGCTLFDIQPFREYGPSEADQEGSLLVFTGKIREMVSLHKDINKVKWIGKREVENYEYNEGEKEIIQDYFNR
jgi:hypothetical protein